MKKIIPNYYAKSIYSLDIDFYKSNGIEFVLCDLDNTLDAFDVYTPNKPALDLVKNLNENNIKFFILSNNREKRVGGYARSLGVKYLCRTCKPSGKNIKKFLKRENLDSSKGIMIGDQLLTDVIAAKNAGIRVCLVDQLVKRDQWCTILNRFIDNRLRKKMVKKGQISRIGE